MSTILTLIRKDIAIFLRNRTAVSLTFIVPIVMITVFGYVFGLNRKDRGPADISLAVVNQAPDNPAARKLVEALKAEKSFRIISDRTNPDGTTRPLTETDVRQRILNRELRFALVIPPDVIPADSIGLHLKILSDPRNEIETQMVSGLLQKTVFSNVPELLGQSLQARARSFLGGGRLDQFNRTMASTIASTFGGNPDVIQRRIESGDFGFSQLQPVTDPKLRRLDAPAAGGAAATPVSTPTAATSRTQDFFSRIVNIENVQLVGKEVKSPDATRVVGGWAIMFLLFAVSGSSAAYFDEKNAGIFQRLLSSPVSRGQLLWSRFLYAILLGLVQLTVLFFAGSLMYGIDVLGHLGNLIVICTASAAACASFGMLIAAFSPNAQAASGLATLFVMLMSSTGGAWWPMSLMPEFMQKIGKCTLVYWSMEGFAQVLWAGNSFLQIMPTVGILFAIAVGVMTISVWRLNQRQIFG
ncbi:MAG TPA: ABC transporter permease [Opitutaceae bacterium]|nr:ABC transporter permease [Opitutaceae bacterium]